MSSLITRFRTKITLGFTILLMVGSVLQGCRKQAGLSSEIPVKIVNQQQELYSHQSKIDTWLKLFPLKGHFSDIDTAGIKTIFSNGVLTTRLPISKTGLSLYFISNESQFHVYGVDPTGLISGTQSGIVNIYDFQTLTKKGLKYVNGQLTNLLLYSNNPPLFNAYTKQYPTSAYKQLSEALYGPLTHRSDNIRSLEERKEIFPQTQPLATADVIRSIRKFFCELFGGTWQHDAYAIDTPEYYCTTGGNGSDEVQQLPPPEASGSTELGLIWQNLNYANYFEATSNLWSDILSGLNAGGINLNWAATGTSAIDEDFEDIEEVRSLYFILNTQYNSEPASPFDGTLNEIFDNFESYKGNPSTPIPIVAALLKMGANGAADALTQALMIYLMEDDCESYFDAFSHQNFSKGQVAMSTLQFWKIPGGRLGKAAALATKDILANAIDRKYGISDWEAVGSDYALNFFAHLAGQAVSDFAAKQISLSKIGKGLIKKFNIRYSLVSSWLGGGIQQITETVNNISSVRRVIGWGENKLAIVGRNMEQRVKPFASGKAGSVFFDASCPLAAPYFTNEVTAEWNYLNGQFGNNIPYEVVKTSKMYQANLKFIQDLKAEGYTFIDCGTGGASSASAFYDMELTQLF